MNQSSLKRSDFKDWKEYVFAVVKERTINNREYIASGLLKNMPDIAMSLDQSFLENQRILIESGNDDNRYRNAKEDFF
jgi:hypothetical protein